MSKASDIVSRLRNSLIGDSLESAKIEKGAFRQTRIVTPTQGHEGRIIGKGGAHITLLRDRTGCDIQIDRSKQPVTCVITGTAANVKDWYTKRSRRQTKKIGRFLATRARFCARY